MDKAAGDLLNHLRNATEMDVQLALDRAYITAPLNDPDELLEFFNRMIDVLISEDDAAEMVDEQNVRAAGRDKGT